MATATNTEDILKQRGEIYGKYSTGVNCRATIVNELNTVYKETHSGESLPENLRIMYGDIALKLMRSASNPTHLDSWVDLDGYSKLIKGVLVDGE